MDAFDKPTILLDSRSDQGGDRTGLAGPDGISLAGVLDGRWYRTAPVQVSTQPPDGSMPRFDRYELIDVAADLPGTLSTVAAVVAAAHRRRSTESSVIVWTVGTGGQASRLDLALTSEVQLLEARGWTVKFLPIEHLWDNPVPPDLAPDDVGAIVVSPAWDYGVRRMPPPLIDKTIEYFGSRGTLIVADESTSGFGRTGPLFASDEWSVDPDMLLLGANATNGSDDLAAVFGHDDLLRRLPRGTLATCSPDPAAVTRMASAAGVHRSLAADMGGLADNAEALKRGLQILVEQGRVADVEGGGWTYAITPMAIGSGHSRMSRVVEVLHEAAADGLRLPAFADGRLLVAPEITSTPGDLARILDTLHGVL